MTTAIIFGTGYVTGAVLTLAAFILLGKTPNPNSVFPYPNSATEPDHTPNEKG